MINSPSFHVLPIKVQHKVCLSRLLDESWILCIQWVQLPSPLLTFSLPLLHTRTHRHDHTCTYKLKCTCVYVYIYLYVQKPKENSIPSFINNSYLWSLWHHKTKMSPYTAVGWPTMRPDMYTRIHYGKLYLIKYQTMLN